jgi:hypothetical protein
MTDAALPPEPGESSVGQPEFAGPLPPLAPDWRRLGVPASGLTLDLDVEVEFVDSRARLGSAEEAEADPWTAVRGLIDDDVIDRLRGLEPRLLSWLGSEENLQTFMRDPIDGLARLGEAVDPALLERLRGARGSDAGEDFPPGVSIRSVHGTVFRPDG